MQQTTRFHMRVEPVFMELMRQIARRRRQTVSEFVRTAIVASIANSSHTEKP